MTLREKAAKEHPHMICNDVLGGVRGCPCQFGYETEDDERINAPCHGLIHTRNNELCTMCWNREYVSLSGPAQTERAVELRNKIMDTCRRPGCQGWLESEIKELLGLFETAIIDETKADFTKKWDV